MPLIARFLVLIGTYLLGTYASCQAEELLVEVTPAHDKIRTGDILFLEVSVVNQGKSPIKLYDRLGSPFGSVIFEVRRPGDLDYQAVSSVGVREASFTSVNIPLEPKARITSSEALFLCHANNLLSSKPGKCSIRAKTSPAGFPFAESNPIDVVVESPSRFEPDSIEAAIAIINFGIGVDGVSFFHDASKYARIANELEESDLQRALLWLAQIARIRDAADAGKRRAERDELEKIRKDSHPFVQDWISLTLAAEYIKLKELDLARKELARIKDGNTEKAALDKRIKSIIRDNAELRGTPKT